jgi:hypothetical protein
VESTFPTIGATINQSIPKISIDFYKPVKRSNGNLSIYQVVEQPLLNLSTHMYKVVGDQVYLLRQSIPSINCLVENDGKTVSADVLESTFSVPKGKYFIEVDNNFVRDNAHNEPLLGIRENVWLFMTEEKKDTYAPGEAGSLRLTINGTKVFNNLTQSERHVFFKILLEELSDAVPIDPKRLTTNKLIQSDNRLNETRYLISIGILATKDEYENSVVSIIKIIDTIVKNQDQSPIGSGRIAGYLDESYGFRRSCEYLHILYNLYINEILCLTYTNLFLLVNLWEEYKISLLSLLSIVGLLIILFLLAERRIYFLQQMDKKKTESKKEEHSLKENYSLKMKNLFQKKVTNSKTHQITTNYLTNYLLNFSIIILLFYNLVQLFSIWLWIFFS